MDPPSGVYLGEKVYSRDSGVPNSPTTVRVSLKRRLVPGLRSRGPQVAFRENTESRRRSD